MVEIAEILERAATRIEPEGRWTQKALARDEGGRHAYTDSPEAACWCGAGAIWAEVASEHNAISAGARCCELLRKAIGTGGGIGPWNDAPDRTQAEVVAKLREAAAQARALTPETSNVG